MGDQNSTDCAIELKSVKKWFGDVVAVDDFSVKIKKGEFFTLVGPSGCGKTTTLRMIAGLEQLSEGTILLDGDDVTGVPAYNRNVNTVFQDYAIFPHMNILKNVYFPLKMRGVDMRKAEPKIKKVLNLVNMEGYARRLPQQLSGGQRQRIALARSLVNEPAALLLDEPLGALDFKLRVAMQKVLKDIQRDVGITFVYVTHDQTEALTMSDRIAVMKGGFVHQIGAPDEIYKHPATAFVASFVGDMNFLYGRFKQAADNYAEVELGNSLIRTKKPAEAFSGQSPVLVCLRAENVLINPQNGKADTVMPAELARIVFRGADYEVSCKFSDGEEVRSVIGAAGWDPSLKLGSTVNVGWKADDVTIFPQSEEKDVLKYEAGET